ncbi:MAG TPA: two-component regulator propeller domain-containing protein [Ignavibacteriaceae bacterium]|nr:two-component regulator propeller domain-containing protein [Ignavibacteriaceae bacterium]
MNLKFIKGHIFLFLILIGFDSIPQSLDIQFTNVGIEDGLSNSTVYSIIQDKKGFMWFGTQNGLNKYNGYNFTVFKNIPFDSTSLTDNWVLALLEDSKGNIWVGTHSGGVSMYDRNLGHFINYVNDPEDTNSLVNNRVWSIREDKYGYIWIGTSSGLDKLNVNTGEITHYLSGEIISRLNNAVNSIYFDKNGIVWVATWGSGLFKLNSDGEIIANYLFDDHPDKNIKASNKIKVIYEDKDEILWLGTNQEGLIRFDKKDDSYKYFVNNPSDPNSLSFNSILSIIEDKKGTLWIGTHNGGLNRFNRKDEKFFSYQNDVNDPYSLSNDWVPALCEDRGGTIWIGSDRGVDKFMPDKLVFKNLKHIDKEPNSLSSNDVHAVYEDSEGMIWVGTWRGGLNRYDPVKNQIKKFFNDPKDNSSLPNDIVLVIMEDRQNNLWIGTYNGLARFDRKTKKFKVFRQDPDDDESIGYNNISALCEDSYGYLWVGTWGGGVQRMDLKTGKFKRYYYDVHKSNGLTDMIVTYIFEDSKRNLYFGTAAGGLNIYSREDDKFQSIQFDAVDKTSISSNNISCIVEDKDGYIWIGTLNGGLNMFNPQTKEFIHYTVANGLPEDAVMSIRIDNDGYLWISLVKGISRFNPTTKQFTNYDYKDGLGNKEFISTSAIGMDGKLLFGGKNGVTYFYPTHVIQPVVKPNLTIVNFSVFNQPLKFPKDITDIDTIEIKYSDNVFSIDFVSLGYARPDKISYAYMLEGFDNDWIHSKNRRTAYYTNLNAGTYHFKVMASSDNYNWFYIDKPLVITIIPPFWQKWWFILSVFVFLIGIILLAYRYRVNQLLKMERLRVRIAQDLHDELASNLSSIAMFGRIIQDTPAGDNKGNVAGEMLDRIINLSQHSVNSIREIIWALDPKTGTLYDLLLKVRDFIVNNARAKKINPVISIPSKEVLPAANLSPELRRNLWLLLKEIFMNSLKHSESKNIFFTASYAHKMLKIEIRDDGKGFDVNGNYDGHGLTNINRRAKQLNADVKVESNEGEGTKYSIKADI